MKLESLRFQIWFWQHSTFFNIKTNDVSEDLHILILTDQHSYNTRSLDQIETYYCRIDVFKKNILPKNNNCVKQT